MDRGGRTGLALSQDRRHSHGPLPGADGHLWDCMEFYGRQWNINDISGFRVGYPQVRAAVARNGVFGPVTRRNGLGAAATVSGYEPRGPEWILAGGRGR